MSDAKQALAEKEFKAKYFYDNKLVKEDSFPDYIPRKGEGFYFNDKLYLIGELIYVHEHNYIQIMLVTPEQYVERYGK